MTDTNISLGTADAVISEPQQDRVRTYWQLVRLRLRHDKVTLFFGAIILTIVLLAVLAPILPLRDPLETGMINRLKPVGYQGFILGTDELGRDMLSRIIWGGRSSLLMGLLPVALALLIGGGLGVIAGFMGGTVNMMIMRVMDVFYAFPSILLAVAISGAMGGGMMNGLISLTVVFIPPCAVWQKPQRRRCAGWILWKPRAPRVRGLHPSSERIFWAMFWRRCSSMRRAWCRCPFWWLRDCHSLGWGLHHRRRIGG